MKEIYELLPNIILYLAIGFVYLRVYRFTSIIQTTKNVSELLIESLVIGFALKCFYNLFPSINSYIDMFGMLISSVIVGFVSAKMFSGKVFNKILTFLDIRQTKSQYIWQDILGDTPIWITAIDYDKDIFYYGKAVLIEGYERKPQILITEYIYEHNDTEIDNTNNPSKTVLIDTSKFQDIWISYMNNEEKVRSWKFDDNMPITICNFIPRIRQKNKSNRKTKNKK